MRVEVMGSYGEWNRRALVIDDLEEWDSKLEATFRRLGKPQLVLCSPRGPLSFLGDLDGLSSLTLIGVVGSRDDSAVAHCQGLQELVLQTDARNAIAFEVMESLRILRLDGHRRGVDRLPASLERLSMQGCQWTDLEPLAGLPELRDVQLVARRLASIAHISECPRLERLGLAWAKVEAPFCGTSGTALRRLVLDECRGRISLEGIGSAAAELERVTMLDLPRLESVAPLAGARKLEYLRMFNVNIRDQDLAAITTRALWGSVEDSHAGGLPIGDLGLHSAPDHYFDSLAW